MTSYRGMRGGLIATTAIYVMAAASPAMAQSKSFNVPAQSAATGIPELARQGDVQILVAESATRGKSIKPVRGTMTVDQALRRALSGTGLRVSSSDGRTFTLAGNAGGEQAPQDVTSSSSEDDGRGVAEILVTGNRTLNIDVRRTRDDIQPYVVMSRQEIERSQSPTLENFLKSRLPMNASAGSVTEGGFALSAGSSVNLRGLGANQTLILINGRRTPGYGRGNGGLEQSSINGIPLSAVERIEVLPATASGIYGGGATGGVINIITRSDYRGAELGVAYGISSRGDAANIRADGVLGFNLRAADLSVFISGSYNRQSALRVSDRDYFSNGRDLLLANNPAAIYSTSGAPVVGYLPNIRSTNGSPLVLDNGTALGSPFTSVPSGYEGPTTDGGLALAQNAGSYSLGVPLDAGSGLATFRPEIESSSGALSLRKEIGKSVSLYGEFSWDRTRSTAYQAATLTSITLDANSAINPFTTQISVSFPTGIAGPRGFFQSETFRGVLGATVRLPHRWSAGVDLSLAKIDTIYRSRLDGFINTTAASAAIREGTIQVLRDVNRYPNEWAPYIMPEWTRGEGPSKTTFANTSLTLSGPAVTLPAGDAVVNGRIEWKRDTLGSIPTINNNAVAIVYGPRSQSFWSYYGELRVPIIAPRNGVSLIHELELQASVRRDDYSTTSSSPYLYRLTPANQLPGNFDEVRRSVSATKFVVGAKYAPSADFALRASYGTGFLPPSVTQITGETALGTPASFLDPMRGNTQQNVAVDTVFGGGRENLKPEESRTFSFGTIITPQSLRGFRLSVDYVEVQKANEIILPTYQFVINNETSLPGAVRRFPLSPADIQAGYTGGAVNYISRENINLNSSRIRSFDVRADFTAPRVWGGELQLYAALTYTPSFSRKLIDSAREINYAGSSTLLKWRGNAGATWTGRLLSIDWNAQYYDSYTVYAADANTAQIAVATLNQGSPRVPSQVYHDILVSLTIPNAGFPTNAKLRLGVENVFDKSPPILASIGNAVTSYYSTFGDNRRRRFTVGLTSNF